MNRTETVMDLTAIEPAIAQMLDDARANRAQPPYQVRTDQEVQASLVEFFKQTPERGEVTIHSLRRMGGGASKEQFLFEMSKVGEPAQQYVLRMDPLESAVTTCRRREAAVLNLAQRHMPAPAALWSDVSGQLLGRPAIITNFIAGVTKPSAGNSNVSGFGTTFSGETRQKLSENLVELLVKLHDIDPNQLPSDCFQSPSDYPIQASLWQVNWWARAWREDRTTGIPLMGLAEAWMRRHLPGTPPQDRVIVHSDFRTGNFLYDEQSLTITGILDWELAHIGDFHEDLAWIALRSWSTEENGQLLASSLLPFEELCARYAELSGRTVNHQTLHFYQVLALYKCATICLATSAAAARRQHNHQDIVLTWLATAGHSFLNDLHSLLAEAESK